MRYGTEHIRARETERVLTQLDLTREQEQAVECLTSELVNELVHGPIAWITAVVERSREPAASEEA